MRSSNHLTWLRRLLILGAVVCGLTATAAGAVGRPPDVRDAASGASHAVPDVFERYAAAHPFGNGLSLTPATVVSRPPDIRDTAASLSVSIPDVFERFATAHPYGSHLSTSAPVSRPPDIDDTALAVRYSAAVQSSAFDWGAWTIGIGTGMGLVLLLGAALVVSWQLRHRAQAV
jgi:hypothetical protein